MSWVVTVYYHARFVDIRYFREQDRARSFYADCLVRYPSDYDITISKI